MKINYGTQDRRNNLGKMMYFKEDLPTGELMESPFLDPTYEGEYWF